MPEKKTEHKNWVRTTNNNAVSILTRREQSAVSFENCDTLVVVIPALPDGSLIMGDVYRAIMDEMSIEFPSSYCPSGQDPNAIARKVAQVHSHASANDLSYLGDFFPCPDLLDLKVHLFSACIGQPNQGQMVPSGGMLSLRAMSIQEITGNIAKGALRDSTTIACLTRYLAQPLHGDGLTTAKLAEIEILDSAGDVVATLMTNSPEWSFNAYAEANEFPVTDWRFKPSIKNTSPTGEPIPVKSSLALNAASIALAKAKPVFTPKSSAEDPADLTDHDPVQHEQESGLVPPDHGQIDDDPYAAPPAPSFLSRRSADVSAATRDDIESDVQAAPVFTSRRSARVSEEPKVTSPAEDTAQVVQPVIEPDPKPEADESGFAFFARRTRKDRGVDIIEDDAEHYAQDMPEPSESYRNESVMVEDAEPVSDLPSDHIREINHPEEQGAYQSAPERRLSLRYKPSCVDPLDDEAAAPVTAVEPEVYDDTRLAEDLNQSAPQPDPVRVPSVSTLPPSSFSTRQFFSRKRGKSNRIEPSLKGRPASDPVSDVVAKTIEGVVREDEPAERKAARQAHKDLLEDAKLLEIPAGLTKFAGFLKKTIAREPEEEEIKETPLYPHMLYGVEDALRDAEPPEPAFRTARPPEVDRDA